MPAFSIITPSYNSARYIEATIRSVADQTFRDFEHIVIDGASGDDTTTIVKRHPHVRLVSEPDRGQSDAINKGFRLSSGRILAWQNADDLYFPHTLQVVADFFDRNPAIDVVYGFYQLVAADGSWVCDVFPPQWNRWLFSRGRFNPLQPTVFWRRRVWERAGELDLSLRYCMDVDFFCRADKAGFSFARIPHMLGKFRTHQESKTHNRDNARAVLREYRSVLLRNYRYSALDRAVFEAFQVRKRIARCMKTRFLRSLRHRV